MARANTAPPEPGLLDFKTEKLIPLTDAGNHRLLRRGRHPLHRSVLERWIKVGRAGVRLQSIKIGRERYTSEESIFRFIERCNTPGATSTTNTRSQVSRQHARAERELQAAGV